MNCSVTDFKNGFQSLSLDPGYEACGLESSKILAESAMISRLQNHYSFDQRTYAHCRERKQVVVKRGIGLS